MKPQPVILSLIPYKILPAQLGGEKGIAIFNEYLAEQVKLTGITTRNNDPAYAKNYRLINSISNSRIRYANVFLYFTIRRLLRQTKANWLLIEHPYYGWLAWFIKQTTACRIVVHSHNMEYMRSKSIGRKWWKLLMWYEQWVYRFADKVFFISEDDRTHAINRLKVKANKSIAITYGIEQNCVPDDRDKARQFVKEKHGIGAEEKIFLFNGALYHSTNYDALSVIINEINPFLLKQPNFRYKILICGKGLPASFNELRDYKDLNVIYAGFVDDIALYFKSADVFLNPILSGGGVKTKAIEALAMNCAVVSTPLGALGINRIASGSKLQVIDEGHWQQFADAAIKSSTKQEDTPHAFFDYYYWKNIIRRAVEHLQS